MFDKLDTDNNDLINAIELKVGLEKLGYANDDDIVKQSMDDADTDGDGLINFEEFDIIMTPPSLNDLIAW